MISPAFNPLEKEGRHAMHIRKIVTLWNWTINGSGEKLQMPIGNDSGIHQNVTEGNQLSTISSLPGGRANAIELPNARLWRRLFLPQN